MQLDEHGIINLLVVDTLCAFRCLDFMLASSNTRHAHREDGFFLSLEVKREELQLEANKIPGDIDLLMIPWKGNQNLCDVAMAVEVKIVRPTVANPSRNANSFGTRQVKGLISDGFPYVGLLHVITPEP